MIARRLVPVLAVLCLALGGCASAGGGRHTSDTPSATASASPDSSVSASSTPTDSPTASAAPGTAGAPGSYPAGGCGTAAPDAVGVTTARTIVVSGTTRSFLLHVPATYAAGTAIPVILAFHGHGMAAAALEGFSGLDAADALVAYPQSGGTSPNDGWQSAPYASGDDDVAFVSALLDDLETHYCVDRTRVDAAGISNGGGFVSLLSCALPQRIAAFAVVAGAIYPASAPACPSAPPVPFIEFHGTADPVIAYDGGTSHGATLASVTQWLDQQVQRAGCATGPASTAIGTDVQQQAWGGCQGRGALVHYRIDGGGHTWPGASVRSGPGAVTSTISATTLIEAFFASHPRG